MSGNGANATDPNDFVRWVTSKLMTHLFSKRRLQSKRAKTEVHRKKSGEPHRIEYFHQLDDGYSHLAAQALKPLSERYDVELVCHLVDAHRGDNTPEPDLLSRLSRCDAHQVAPEYGLRFPRHDEPVHEGLIDRAASILAAQDSARFIDCAAEVGQAMWSGDQAALDRLAKSEGSASTEAAEQKILDGTRRRGELGHYSGAMFHYGDEWYWGVDRLYHLERRLSSLGADRCSDKPPLFDRPPIEAGPLQDDGRLTLEVYPSLRSPYTAISFDRAVKLARESGVRPVIRPVLPMVMRGVPATREKGMYIFMDAAREAYAAGVPYGKFSDPIGEPVRQAYSLYGWAEEQGKGAEFISSFLSAAFARGINTNRSSGLKHVVQQAGLDWDRAREKLGKPGWQDALEENRLAMYTAGLWGVPSFRLLDAQGKQIMALWGQDRLWLIARAIQRELTKADR